MTVRAWQRARPTSSWTERWRWVLRYRSRLALILTLTSIVATNALAFDDPAQFIALPTLQHPATLSASAEGIYFTGAPRFSGLDCASCHTDGPGKVDIRINADVVELFSDGYQPGQTYQLQVQLLNEQMGIPHNTMSGTCTE